MEKTKSETELSGKAENEKRENGENAVLSYIKSVPKRFFITAFSGMAQGLFVTLIAGTILGELAGFLPAGYFRAVLLAVASTAKTLMGAGIGVGIAVALGKSKLLTFSAAVAGFIGAFSDKLVAGSAFITQVMEGAAVSPFSFGLPGNPIGAYVCTMLVVEVGSLYAGKTKLDILFVPLGALITAVLGAYIAYPFILLVSFLGDGIAVATNAAPFLMGMIVSVSMGILLTMPTSSAAIWVAVTSSVSAANEEALLLAGGAATVGCACHMIGFAVSSFRENGVGGLISQGLGTSMLQIPNIMKKPVVMLPEIVASAVLGPLSTCVFHVKCGQAGGGMGTSGLVGVIDAFKYTSHDFLGIAGIFLLMFVLPAVLCVVISEFMRKRNRISFGDLKLDD